MPKPTFHWHLFQNSNREACAATEVQLFDSEIIPTRICGELGSKAQRDQMKSNFRAVGKKNMSLATVAAIICRSVYQTQQVSGIVEIQMRTFLLKVV